ncbi:hypothetical protein [Aureimonas mangrovi]|uniref:hypothetical protein n=1 Tax=Aureimonas mangrovi TaxID=2758041 RepID=UPI001AEDB36A|nr:hypothetical protein [Aureimonas mangrovi]
MAIIYAAMGLVALVMLIFLVTAAFVWFAAIYGALYTALGFAAACLFAIAVLYVLLIIARRPPKQRASDRLQRDIASIASVAAVSNLPLMVRSVRRRKSLLLLPVAGVGVWAVTRLVLSMRDR